MAKKYSKYSTEELMELVDLFNVSSAGKKKFVIFASAGSKTKAFCQKTKINTGELSAQ